MIIIFLYTLYYNIVRLYINEYYKKKYNLFFFYMYFFQYIGQSLVLIPYTINYYTNKTNGKKNTLKEERIMKNILIYSKKNNLKKYNLNFLLFSTFILSLMEIFKLRNFSK